MPARLDDFEVLSRADSAGDVETGAKNCWWIKVRRKCDGKIFLWKELNYEWFTAGEKEIFLSELNQTRNFKENYILQCCDLIDNLSTSTIFVITEYYENGNIQKLINRCRNDGTYLHGNFVWKILYQLLRALEIVNLPQKSETSLFHHISPSHIYLDSKWNVKLGIVDLLLDQYFCFQKSFNGFPWYISPEQMNKKPCSVKSQVWSVGCVIYELCALIPPFSAANWSQLMSKFYQNIQRIPWIYSDELHNIICEMLTFKEEERPTISKLLSKPIFTPFQLKSKKSESHSSMWDILYQQKLKGINQKEKSLVLREKNLIERQFDIEESERKLNLKMKNLADQLDRAEKIVGHLTSNRTFASAPELNIVDSKPPLPIKQRKKVHFKLDSADKENDFHKNRQELERRLQKAQIRALDLRTEEIQSRHFDKAINYPR